MFVILLDVWHRGAINDILVEYTLNAVSIIMNSHVKVVQPTGILDSTKTNQFRAEISELVNSGAKMVLVNLKDITFIDSSGLGALVIALKTVRSAGGRFYICSINEQVRILFELTSMDQVFEVYDNQEAFEQAVLSPS
jgi:anti-anti-sigma factor